jgi:ankyrin repeat protein
MHFSKGGHTALCLSCIGGHVEVLRYLIQAGADLSLTTQDGACALHWASYCGRVECVRTLLQALETGRRLPATSPLQTTTTSGFAPLLLATCGGHEEVVRMMTNEYGVDVNQQNEVCHTHCQ